MSEMIKKEWLGVCAVTPQGTLVRESIQTRSSLDPFSLSMSDLYLVWTDGWVREYFEKTLGDLLYDIDVFDGYIRSHMPYGDDDFFVFYEHLERELDALEDIFAELCVCNIDTVYHVYSDVDELIRKEHNDLISLFRGILKRIQECRSRANELFLERFLRR